MTRPAPATAKLLMAILLSAFYLGTIAVSARALTTEVSCSQLQTKIDQIAHEADHGEGEKIVLDGMCDATDLGSAGGVTLPGGSAFVLEGKPDTTSGLDGTGVSGPLLSSTGSEEVGAMTLSNLTFAHADLTDASAVSIRTSHLTLKDDRFLENEERGDGAHTLFVALGGSPADCPTASGPTALTLTGSTFAKNKLVLSSPQGGGGAGAWLEDACPSSREEIEEDDFDDNTLEASGTSAGALVTGAGLQFVGNSGEPATVTQRGNVFDSNDLVAPAPDLGNYGGGGEWLENASLSSVGDRFSRNAIAGTSNISYEAWSWGAGLGISNLSFACSQSQFPVSTLEDAVATSNAIGPGTTADLGGGGIWVGCTRLRVLDSTFTLNGAPYGAGIEGEPGDQLELVNSIVSADTGGEEIAGFEGEPSSSLSAGFSDVCAGTDSSTPLPGDGNICASPALADSGDPSSFDVHENEVSPTIDAGSNALVPEALTSDFYGNQRVLAGRSYVPLCTTPAEVLPLLDPPVVDMGAVEFGPIAVADIKVLCKVTTSPPATIYPTPTPQGPTPHPSSRFSFPSVSRKARGLLLLTFKGLPRGQLDVNAGFTVYRSVVTIAKGVRRRVRIRQRIGYCRPVRASTGSGNLSIALKPTKQTLGYLTRGMHPGVSVSIELSVPGAAPSRLRKTVQALYRQPSGKH
ncbi:MAG: hypothetical protein WB998_05550 [Solirubrobacteraceae bacterium]